MGFRALRAVASELEREVPFAVLSGLLGTGLPEPASEGVSLRFVLLDRIVDEVEQITLDEPLLLEVEDLHWADEASLVGLHRILRRAPQLPVAVLATARPTPRRPELDQLIRSLRGSDHRHVILGPLPAESVTALLRQLLGATPGPALVSRAEPAAGNPLFLTELVRALQGDGLLDVRDGVAEATGGAVPSSLRVMIVRTLGFLQSSTLDVLRSASLLGVSFSLDELAAVTDGRPEDLHEQLSEAMGSGVFIEDGDRLAFRHELVRDAVYEDVPLAMRRVMHRDAGRQLAAYGAKATVVATHMDLGASPGDLEVVTWLRRAADESVSRSWEAYVRYVERALELLTEDAPGGSGGEGDLRREIVAHLVEPLVNVGRSSRAEELGREWLRRRGPAPLEAMVRHALGVALQQQNRLWEAAQEWKAGAAARGLPEGDRARMLAYSSNNALLLGDLEAAESDAAQAVAVGERLDDDWTCADALGCLAMVAAARGRPAEAVSLAQRAVGIADAHPARGHPDFVALRVHLGCSLLDTDAFDDATREFGVGLRMAERHGLLVQASMLQAGLAATGFFGGDWEQASAGAEAAVRTSEEGGMRVAGAFSRALLARMLIAADELEAAEEQITTAEGEGGPQLGVELLIWSRALLMEARGEVEQAKRTLENGWSLVAPFRYFLSYRSLAPDLVRLALLAGDMNLAAGVTDEVEEGARRSRIASAEAAALRCRGLVGDDVELKCAAVDAYRRSPRKMDLALACEEAGAALSVASDVARALPLLEEAFGGFERLGAERDARRTERLLRSLGGRVRRVAARARSVTGWDSLTPTEVRVVELVCEGMTNREAAERLFVSRRTIDTHLTHVFQKLGVRSRTQLVARAMQERA
ncbi:MAG: ATP-binding protein, partial [Candidatus Binatia bacterium]